MGGIPVPANVSAALAATVNARHNGGDHSLFIGRIVGLRDDGRALWFIMNHRKETAADPTIDFCEFGTIA